MIRQDDADVCKPSVYASREEVPWRSRTTCVARECARCRKSNFGGFLGARRLALVESNALVLTQCRIDRVAVEAATEQHRVEPLATNAWVELCVAALGLSDR